VSQCAIPQSYLRSGRLQSPQACTYPSIAPSTFRQRSLHRTQPQAAQFARSLLLPCDRFSAADNSASCDRLSATYNSAAACSAFFPPLGPFRKPFLTLSVTTVEGFSSVCIGTGYRLALCLIWRRHKATNKLVILSIIPSPAS
jgi:hypothetical protein